MRAETERHLLFSYGTLRQAEVQRGVFGRALRSTDDRLPGFRIDLLRVTDPHVVALSGSDRHPVLRRGGAKDIVAGSALEVSADDLARADRYEVSDYARMLVKLESGRDAFVYVHRDEGTAEHEPA